MLLRRYEMPWRRAAEADAALAWTAALAHLAWQTHTGALPPTLAAALGVPCAALALWRARRAQQLLALRAALGGHATQHLDAAAFARLCADPEAVFLGFGFEWQPVHAQRLYELAKVDYRDHLVAPWLARWLRGARAPQPDGDIGLPYLHGVEPREQTLVRPLRNFEGGTLLVGTTQSGKGVALANLITQAVRRGDVVIVIDPKNSARLKRCVQHACARYRDADTFLEFHPAFPERGVRLDFTFHWQKPTEIASRIRALLPPDTAGAFSAFGWDAVNVVVQGLVALGIRPNLMTLAKTIEGGIEPVLDASLQRFLAEWLGPQWRADPTLQTLLREARRPERARSATGATGAHDALAAYVAYYEQYVPAHAQRKVIDAQVRTFRHNREHYQKITANLLPVLSMLTSGELGKSLSPDPFDGHDGRPIFNFEKIERGRHVLYLCLDALPDPSVASAIGALALADFAARAGMRYNLGEHCRIALFVDEVANVINAPLIEILNKGAEGGIMTTCALQTLADLAARLGSEAAARMALGNLNNLIALRSKDRPTQDFIVETFGKTAIHTLRVGRTHAHDGHVGDFSAALSTQVAESREELVPADALGKLPNLQYFAAVAGGRLLKGRWPILDTDGAPDTGPAAPADRPGDDVADGPAAGGP